MAQNEKKIYQFKITLKGVKPSIWRRIQVPENYNFENLSDAILSAMGWYGTHLHSFTMKNPITGEKEEIGEKSEDNEDCISERRAKIRDYFIDNKSKAEYLYDFGDCWEHVVQLMKILPADPKKEYPRCVAGKRACPSEDCGGYRGYMELVEAWKKENPTEEEKKQLKWYHMDEGFDPEKFDMDLIEFEPLNKMKKEHDRCCVS